MEGAKLPIAEFHVNLLGVVVGLVVWKRITPGNESGNGGDGFLKGVNAHHRWPVAPEKFLVYGGFIIIWPPTPGVFMIFPHPLIKATFLKREKRFLVHAQLEDGRQIIAHTNNTGSMRGCLSPEAEIWLSPAQNPARKLKWTLELVRTQENKDSGVRGGVLVGVNTILANKLVREALENDLIPLVSPGSSIESEVRYGQNSRVDFLISDADGRRCWTEVKNVSLVENDHARFPDSPTERGRKHLLELEARVQAGDRAALVFCIQRNDAQSVGPADDIDPLYGQLLRQVSKTGVEVFAIGCKIVPSGIIPHKIIPIMIE